MYAKYRRPEYGILEGGHHFTPDRLHNDYLEKLTNRGDLGFIAYYILFIGYILYIFLQTIYKHGINKKTIFITGVIASMFSFQGQLFFNFGVVPTLSIYYSLIALEINIHRVIFK